MLIFLNMASDVELGSLCLHKTCFNKLSYSPSPKISSNLRVLLSKIQKKFFLILARMWRKGNSPKCRNVNRNAN